MISSIDISGVKYTLDKATVKYVQRKIAQLDKYLPKHARKSVTADVKLKQVNKDHGNKYEAEVILNVPDKRMTAKDSTVSMLAAIDIVQGKLMTQLKKYKQMSMQHVGQRRHLSRTK